MLTIGNFPTLIGGSTALALGIGAVLVVVTLVGVVVGARGRRGSRRSRRPDAARPPARDRLMARPPSPASDTRTDKEWTP